jgi:hypothetical protein
VFQDKAMDSGWALTRRIVMSPSYLGRNPAVAITLEIE